MVHYLYNFDYSLPSSQKHRGGLNKLTQGPLVTHAKVYALAQKYLIRGLKGVALRKFKTAVGSTSPDDCDLIQAIQEVYTSTGEDDRGLRDIIVEKICHCSAWLDREDVQGALKGLGALTYDIVLRLHQNGRFSNCGPVPGPWN
jgi:hypothetical protein